MITLRVRKQPMSPRYIDVMVADGSSDLQAGWNSGLEAVSELAMQRFGRDFMDCDAGQRDAVVAEMTNNEDDPRVLPSDSSVG